MRTIKIGSPVAFTSREHKGRGKVVQINPTAKGPYYVVKTKDHPKGHVQVRLAQLS